MFLSYIYKRGIGTVLRSQAELLQSDVGGWIMDLAKKAEEQDVIAINDGDLDQVSGGADYYWVPGGHDPNDRLVRCPYCRAKGIKHVFWVSSWGNIYAECQKSYPYKQFKIFEEGTLIHLQPGDPYPEDRR